MPNHAADQLTKATYMVTVARTKMVTPQVCRVTLTGDDLAGYPDGVGADHFAYLLLPPGGRTEMTIDRDFEWSTVRAMPRTERPRGAYYSVRHHRPDDREIDLDVIIHDGGTAATWAANARPGSVAALWGPRVLFRPPADTEWLLLVADDTGVPAMLSILEHRQRPVPAIAVAEVANADEIRQVTSAPDVDLRWRCRGSAEVPAAEVVATLQLPTGPGYAWGGGEQAWIHEVDAVIADVHGLSDDRRSLTSYWRRGARTGLQ